MRIVAYVDGFSVYYACFRGPTKTPYAHLKWLNYRLLFEAMFPQDSIDLVRIYTAIAPNPPDDPQQASRHDAFIRALRTLPNVEVYVGRFQKSKREAFLVRPIENAPIQQTVYIFQEKKSDVSLATHLMVDAFEDRFDRAVVLTNDTDFTVPVSMVCERFHREVIVVSPDITLSRDLAKAGTSGHVLDRGLLSVCQLTNPVVDAQGRSIHKPTNW